MRAVSRRMLAASLSMSLLSVPILQAQQPAKSPDAAKALTAALDAGGFDSIAAADPDNAGVFFGALYFPGLQLLVVSAKYAVPALLQARLRKKEYRDLYLDLMSASEPDTKVFIQDLGANGLAIRPDHDEAPDTYEKAGKRVTFDHDWKAQGLNEDAYNQAFADADAAYTRILQALLAQAKQGK